MWMPYRDQAFVQSNLAKLVHLLKMRLVNPWLSPSSIPKICPPFKLRGGGHISAARHWRCGSNSAQRISSRHVQRRNVMPTCRALQFNVTCLSWICRPTSLFPHPGHIPCDRGGKQPPPTWSGFGTGAFGACGRPRGGPLTRSPRVGCVGLTGCDSDTGGSLFAFCRRRALIWRPATYPQRPSTAVPLQVGGCGRSWSGVPGVCNRPMACLGRP